MIFTLGNATRVNNKTKSLSSTGRHEASVKMAQKASRLNLDGDHRYRKPPVVRDARAG